ncbi:MAG: ABC transporter substrate-binding protein [Deltaproteobacteria bacterium]|nr:ABC transporter substrate-binding protein [Deltaproteobacteria bacterium]
MSQYKMPPEARQPAKTRRKGVSLKWKITGAWVGLILLFGLLVAAAGGQIMTWALRRQVEQRASTIATNFSDAATGLVIGRKPLELNALISKYALLDGVAYISVRDGKDKVLAQSPASSSVEFEEMPAGDQPGSIQQRRAKFSEKNVYDTRVPLLGGQAGSVHVGLWEEAVHGELEQALLLLIGAIAVAMFLAMVLSILLARKLTRPILHLTQAADLMSKGDLDTPISMNRRDEMGDLARALERMRSSLKAAMVRLARDRSAKPETSEQREKDGQTQAREIRVSRIGAAILCLLGTLSSASAAPAGAAPEQRQQKIVVAYSGLSGSQLPAWVAYEKGFFRKGGLDATLLFVEGGAKAVQTLISGEVAFAQIGGFSVLESRLQGSDVVIIAGFLNTMDYQLIVSRNITEPEQLKGKSVAVSRFGSSSDFAMRYALEKYGLKPNSDVTLVQIGSQPARLAALQAGKIQGAMMAVPHTLQAKKSGLNVLADLQMLGLEYQHTGLAATGTLIKTQPDLARDVVKALVEAIHYLKTHRKDSLEILAKYLKTNDVESLEETYEAVGLNLIAERPYPTLRGIRVMLREMAPKYAKALAARPDQFVNLSFVQELDRSLFIDRLYQSRAIVPAGERPNPPTALAISQRKAAGRTSGDPSRASAGDPGRAQDYTVKTGDSLARLAEKFYGSAHHWRKIYLANAGTMKNPNQIHVGQKVLIPAAETTERGRSALNMK